MSRPRGRPIRPAEERMSEVVSMRVTPAELDAIHRGALRSGESVNRFLRRHLQGFIVYKKIESDQTDPTIGS